MPEGADVDKAGVDCIFDSIDRIYMQMSAFDVDFL